MSNQRKLMSLLLLVVMLMGLALAACGPVTQQETTGDEGTTTGDAASPIATGPGPMETIEATVPTGGTATASPAAGAGTTPAAQCEDTGEELLIYSSLPLTGTSRAQTVSVNNGAQMAIDEHGGKAGGYTIRFEQLDDATAAAGKWTPEKETENANKAIQDGATVYIGTFNSGAAAISIPILNKAGIPMISPANTAINLTRPGPPDPGLFESLYQSGPRNYFRVVGADHLQGAAGANWAQELGAQSVYILHDQEVYGLGLAQVFRQRAEDLGLEVLGFEGIDPKAGSYATVMDKVTGQDPDLIYFAGLSQTGGPQLAQDLRDIEPDTEAVKFMGPDGILETAFIEGAGEAAEGTYGTVAAAPPANLTGPGKEFYEAYRAKYNEEPEPYAIFGHDAMLAALLAIDKACSKDPRDVLEALNNLGTVDGALGEWSFDEAGDTTLNAYHGYIVQDGEWTWVQQLSTEGAPGVEAVTTPTVDETPADGETPAVVETPAAGVTETVAP